jgi:hypothetical protein
MTGSTSLTEDGQPTLKIGHERGRLDPEVARYADSEEVISEEEDRRLRKLIDERVLLVMVVTYFLQTLDKGTMSFASIMNLRTDLKLVGQQVCLSLGQ